MKRFSLKTLNQYCLVLLLLLSGFHLQAEEVKAQASGETTEASTEDKSAGNGIQVIQEMVETLRSDVSTSKVTIESTQTRIKSINAALELLDKNLLKTNEELGDSREEVSVTIKNIEKLSEEVVSLSRDIRANTADMVSQKSLIEDNSIRVYEILIRIGSLSERLENAALSSRGSGGKQSDVLKESINKDMNRLWMLLSTVLVFFTPLAFVLSSSRDAPLADGTEQHQGMLLACLGVFLGFFLVGFGLMYGESLSGWIGIPTHLSAEGLLKPGLEKNFPFSEFVMYKMGFEMLAALIVYVAIGRQLSGASHMLLALFVGALLIPVYGHWVSSSSYIELNPGWLEGAGFVDQAGAMTINTIAGWFSFILAWRIGVSNPLPSSGKASDQPVYSSSATILLWLSWMGFTTGTLPISSDQISHVMLNVSLAASAGGITAFLHYVFFNSDSSKIARGLGGFVSGLVAISACAQSVTYAEALLLGAVAGLLQNYAYGLLRKRYLNQDWQVRAAYLVAIHGVAGIWGALCFALLGTQGNFSKPNFPQLVTQIQGIAAAVAYSIVMAYFVLTIIRNRQNKAKKAKS